MQGGCFIEANKSVCFEGLCLGSWHDAFVQAERGCWLVAKPVQSGRFVHRTYVVPALTPVRRFLMHIVPKGLMRVRHYGFLASRCRRRKLAEVRCALEATEPLPDTRPARPESPCCRRCGHRPLNIEATHQSMRPWRGPPG